MSSETGIFRKNLIFIATGSVVSILSFLWFYFPARYVLIANQDTTLFLTTPDYFAPFLKHPGGLLEVAGSFLNQFMRFPLTGALLLSAMGTLLFFLSARFLRDSPQPAVRVAAGFLAAAMVVAMHNYYPHRVYQTLGWIVAMILADQVPSGGRKRRFYLILVVPLLYYSCGGYLWFFLILFLLTRLSGRGKPDREVLFFGVLYPAGIFLAGLFLVFLQPWTELALFPLPLGPSYGPAPWPLIFVLYIFCLPFLAQGISRWKWSSILKGSVVSLVALTGAVLLVRFSYNRKNAEFYTIESLALKKDWTNLTRYAAQHPSTNLFGTFYTNLALFYEGRLCTDLFSYSQPFGRRGLCFGWEAKGEVLRRGGDFYWAIGFVNEAHHWAYESMIVDGLTRRNLERLVQTELVRGNFKVAEKYIGWMEESLFGGPLADRYRHFLEDPESVLMDPELGPRASVRIGQDFFADGMDLEKNLKALLVSEPSSLPVLEYLMALYLLESRIDEIVALLPGYLRSHTGPLPVPIEESLLVYQITHREDKQANLRVSEQTIRRFDEYTSVLRQSRGREEAARNLYPRFGRSFWFYYNFIWPSISNRS